MQIAKNKTKATAIAIFLVLTITATFVALPIANAHTPPWTIPTHAYLVLAPDPVGVNQQVFAVFWLDWAPPTAAGLSGDRWTGLKLEITKPDGSKETLGPFMSDPVGFGFVPYTPDQVGTYKFVFSFPGQVASLYHPVTGIPGDPAAMGAMQPYINDTFLPSSTEKTLTVQQEPVAKIPDTPLPTEYWTRPIEGQNTAWFSIASNWLGGGLLVHKVVQPNGIAPNSPHIMWTKPLQDGGVVGGSYTIDGITYYAGGSYEARFLDPIIMQGRLYYPLPRSSAGGNRAGETGGGGYMCVDLRTGEEIWYSDELGWTDNSAPKFGQLFFYDSMNQHGVIQGILWQTLPVGQWTTWKAYDSLTGKWLYTLTDVPKDTASVHTPVWNTPMYGTTYGPKGEIVRYVLNYPGRWLALWNNTAAMELTTGVGIGNVSTRAYWWRPIDKTVNMSRATGAYSWNVTIPNLPGLYPPMICGVINDDLLLGASSIFTTYTTREQYGMTQNPYTFWAISLKPATRGQLLWIKNYSAPAGNHTIQFGVMSSESRVFTTYEMETMEWSGYSIDNGSRLWGPVKNPGSDWTFNDRVGGGHPVHEGIGAARATAYGNFYTAGYVGIVSCFDMKNGSILWTYGNGGAGNSTYSGLDTLLGHYPTFMSNIADGKIYTYTSEHSVNAPIYKGAKIRCIDAFTGKELWTISGFSEADNAAVADGYFTYFNEYDGQVYCIGKGPSATTVSAPQTGITQGQSVMITGTVIDTAAGTKQNEQAARFPNGVAAVSDASMSAWMEYVYMQKPCPADVKGVEVTLDVIDSNGNYRNIGTATSDASGFFSYMWTPDIPGKYTVIATFAGSESYWPSYAETAFGVDEAPPEIAPPEYPQPIDPTWTIVGVGIALLIAIILVGLWIKKK